MGNPKDETRGWIYKWDVTNTIIIPLIIIDIGRDTLGENASGVFFMRKRNTKEKIYNHINHKMDEILI